MLVPDDNNFDIGTLAVVHKSDRGHVNRVGANTTLLHEAPAKDDGEVAVLGKHNSARNGLGADLNGPLAKVGDAVETVGTWSGVLGDETVVESKASADVDVSVARLEHHGDILDGTNATFEETNTELRVELLEGDLVGRNGRDGSLVGLAGLAGVCRDGVLVGSLWCGRLGKGRLAVAGLSSRLARGRVHDRVSAASSDSSGFAVVIGGRDVRGSDTVDADTAALATTRSAVNQGRLVNEGDVGTVMCAIGQVLFGAVVGRDLGRFEVHCNGLSEEGE